MSSIFMLNMPLPTQKQPIIWPDMPITGLALTICQSLNIHNQLLLAIVPDQFAATQLMQAIIFFQPSWEKHIAYFPDRETLPYDHFSPHQDITSARLTFLSKLRTCTSGILITSITTLMHHLPPHSFLDQKSFILNCKDKLNLDTFKERLTHAGYHHVSEVREHGEYAIRGSLLDIFPMGANTPFRLDLFDDEIESIRIFSSDTQRSINTIPYIQLLPAKEFPLDACAIDLFRKQWRARFSGNPLDSSLYQDVSEGFAAAGVEYYLPLFFEKTATLFDYLPSSTIILPTHDVTTFSEEFYAEITMRYEQTRHNMQRPLLPPDTLFLSPNEIKESIKRYSHITVKQQKIADQAIQTINLNHNEHQTKQTLSALHDFCQNHHDRILFCTETIGRREILLPALKTINIIPEQFSSWHDFLNAANNRFGIIVSPIEQGLHLVHDKIILLSEQQLYPQRIMQRRLRKKSKQDPDQLIRDLSELQLNEAVVHIDHGIGRYRGLQRMSIDGQENEFVMLEYQDNAKLYIPIAALHNISRYTGSDLEHIPLNRLGSDHWQRAKRRAREKIRDVAAELLQLYADRAAQNGFAYQIPDDQYANFCAEFPFEETPDQLQAIDQVFSDMQSTQPMDRVICGDVGFGKTEVAIRAAFLAVQNSKQVAILVPTTLLAQQHYNNIQNRLAEWPINVALLSRFKSSKEQKATLTKLENGSIDIIIGTHKLIQRNIKFKDLGLIIIDEEHRFGVKQKETLKQLKSNVDLLTLTATPIPRTLNMSLAGIRDLSIIATPPAKRLAVKTFVHEYQDSILQEAILREILRGGQVYFLHNDVASIDKKADEIKKIIKEARVGIAHGQMNEHDLERIMSSFYHRQINVLVCSTIIESGIDIPTANTIIINRADKLGLAQLHQLRGRVGRSHHQAYAYFLTPSKSLLTTDAIKRLDAISAFDQLGIGFSLASQDLEIRGAGELLGHEQSGNMHEIGFTLYMELLSRAIDDLKQGKTFDINQDPIKHHAELDLHLPAFIPDNYLGDVQLRLTLYKRIANAESKEDLHQLQVEMIDRFGLLPDQTKNLFAIAELKQIANQLGICKLDASNQGGSIEFGEKMNIPPEKIIKLIQAKNTPFRLKGGKQLRFNLPPHEQAERIKKVEEILFMLAN